MEGVTIPTMTADETVKRMREMGLSISKEKLYAGAEQGVYPFANVVRLRKRELTVYTRLFEEWVQRVGFMPKTQGTGEAR